MNGWWIAVWVVVGLALLWLGISFACYCMAFFNLKKEETPREMPQGDQYEHARQRMDELIDEMEPLPWQWLELDGLWARYLHQRDGAPLQIQVHGYKGCGLRDFCGGNKLAREAGHNTLVIDQRAHGRSKGRTIGFGERECQDVKRWAEWMAQRFGRDIPIILSGVSMGAATVLLCAGMEINANIVGIIADCPYSSSRGIIAKVARDMGFPSRPVMPFIITGARIFGGLRLDADVCAAVQKAKVPILILHGEADRFVPCEMSREIYAAAPQRIRLETFPSAGHGLSFIEDFDRYRQCVTEFITTVIPK